MGKPSKNQLKSTAANAKDVQVKYDDPRMAYLSTKPELVVKESENITLGSIINGTISDKSLAVIAEDHLGYYVTCKSMVGANMLDPYRNYYRDKYEIVKDGDNFKVVANGNEFVF
jgi:hypothetical protein